MKLTRTSLGLAVRAARDQAKLTLSDLSAQTGIPTSTLSKTENGLRALEFNEALAIANVCKIDVEVLRTLAETFEREGAHQKQSTRNELAADLNNLQRLAIESAISAKAGLV